MLVLLSFSLVGLNQAFSMAQTEMEYRVELFNKYLNQSLILCFYIIRDLIDAPTFILVSRIGFSLLFNTCVCVCVLIISLLCSTSIISREALLMKNHFNCLDCFFFTMNFISDKSILRLTCIPLLCRSIITLGIHCFLNFVSKNI